MHIHRVEDKNGNLVDIIPFCSDYCHRSYCLITAGLCYTGWDGCHEPPDYHQECANCGAEIPALDWDAEYNETHRNRQ